MLMHLVVHRELLIVQPMLSTRTTSLSWLILAASIWNTILASYSKPNEPWFVWTSISQAFSTGSWVGFLCAGPEGPFRESLIWGMWTATLLNWFVFRYNTTTLKRMFRISYLDTLFLTPVWIFIWRSNH